MPGVELHIEQGPVLGTKGLPVGIVTAIAGGSRLMIECPGAAAVCAQLPQAIKCRALPKAKW